MSRILVQHLFAFLKYALNSVPMLGVSAVNWPCRVKIRICKLFLAFYVRVGISELDLNVVAPCCGITFPSKIDMKCRNTANQRR